MSSIFPKTILMTADPIGGVWTYALELASALGIDGVRLLLATMGAPLSAEQRAEAKGIDNIELFESNYKLEWMDEPWSEVDRAGEWLLKLEEQYSPGLIHLNGYSHATLPWHAPTLVVAHSCVFSWWRAVKGEIAPRRWHVYRKRVRAGLRAADLIIAPSRAMASELTDFYGVFNFQVIPNGRNPTSFFDAKKEPLILSAGRLWDEAKNISALAAVAPNVKWPIHVAGDPPPSAQAMGSQSLCFLGHLQPGELSKWFARASIYVLPARYEPFGLSILEAALSGCALILGDIPSLRENWNEAAVFVKPNDHVHLAQCLQKWINDPADLREWATHARVRARQFSSEQMAEHYRRAYAGIISKKLKKELCES